MNRAEKIKYYCISLISRKDRRDNIQKLFEKLEIEVSWWIVEKHPSGGIFGCSESHMMIWQQKHETEYVCIFEDDLELFEEDCIERFRRCIKDIEKRGCRDYDLLNLEPGVGYYEEDGFFFSKRAKDEFRSGFATRLGCYFSESKRLNKLAEKVKPLYGMDIDLAIYGNCKMAITVVPLFRQNKELGTDNDGGVHNIATYVSNYGLEFSRELFTVMPGLGKLYMNCMSGVSYATASSKKIELKDRRVNSSSFLLTGNDFL
ncbi:MAG: hypothetical protein Solivirus2_12 [Solivirus sp.]|uniref:Glycosyl transferase family 25 domain-containing protein n=1 Tax=Solivirus sp. TaxID=2487772 RepID=A0A3G5AI12_9VIRU|nr:MAG: hypothetical protein Solivirus2_12 [Solivirus sp.]